MKHFVKILIATTAPAFVVTSVLAESAPPPSTQPATQPSTQPALGKVANANAPLVIPDGTSRENPGSNPPPRWKGTGGEVAGARR